MTFESDVYAAMIASSELTALIGDRLTPSHHSHGTQAPYAVYTTIFADGAYDLDGPTGLERVRLQVDCYAETADEARLVAEAVVASIPEEGWPVHGNCINNADFESELGLYRRVVEFRLFHREDRA